MAKAFAYKALYTPKEMWSIEVIMNGFQIRNNGQERKQSSFRSLRIKTPKTFERKWSRLYR